MNLSVDTEMLCEVMHPEVMSPEYLDKSYYYGASGNSETSFQ